MSRYSNETRAQHFHLVRKAIIEIESKGEYPSIERIFINLDAADETLSRDYIHSIKRKIEAWRAKFIDTQVLSRELAKIEGRFDYLKNKLYRVLEDEMSTPKEKIMAAKVIADMDKALIDIKFDSGTFKRQLGKLDFESPAAILIGRIMGDGRKQIPSGSRFISRLRGTDIPDNALSLPAPDSGKDITVGAVPEVGKE